jgi:hypothetical protein
MQKRRFSILIVLLAGAIRGQEVPGPFNSLNFDTSKLRVSLTMDRSAYLPGEAARITLEVFNPGPPIVAPIPFLSGNGCLYPSAKVGNEFKIAVPEPCGIVEITSASLTRFATGEHRQKVLNSYDALFDTGERVLPGAGEMPSYPGAYRLTYRYGTTEVTADFTVVPVKLEAAAFARINDVLYTQHPDLQKPQVWKHYAHLLALREGNQTYICVSQASTVHSDSLYRNGDGSFSPFGAAPFTRVATTAQSVVSLSATADSQENLTIEWQDVTGRRQTLYYTGGYPGNRRPAHK